MELNAFRRRTDGRAPGWLQNHNVESRQPDRQSLKRAHFPAQSLLKFILSPQRRQTRLSEDTCEEIDILLTIAQQMLMT